jgi:hypothetical protein
MAYLETSALAWAMGSVQIIGLLSAWLARLSEGSSRQVWFHALFFGCLALMGLATMAFVALGTQHWLGSGTTLSVMVLAAVWDFRTHASVTIH